MQPSLLKADVGLTGVEMTDGDKPGAHTYPKQLGRKKSP